MRILDYFEIEERPVIVDRPGGVAWEWSRGQWRDAPDLVEVIYTEGVQLGRSAFEQKFPYAVLDLQSSLTASAPL